MMTAKRRLRNLRKLLGLSQQEVADCAGFTKQAYSKLESGQMAARPERMAPINKLFRSRREHVIDLLQSQIEDLRSYDIDESLYLKDEPARGVPLEVQR